MMSFLSSLFAAIAAWFGWKASPEGAKAAQADRQARIDADVATTTEAVRKGDEDAVNAKLQQLLKLVAVLGCLELAGCTATTVVYVPESEQAVRLQMAGKPGWWLPDSVMARLMEDATRWQTRPKD